MRRKIVLAAVLVVVAAAVAAFTVPITVGGKAGPPQPGSADYAAPLASTAIPPVPPKFGGEIKPVEKGSKVWWPPAVVPPKGAPTVLLIMTDDVGFGAPSTFGGVIPTPALDRIAQAGLRYTRFHTTALCSPTRAALLTGRNHHSAGFGVISEMSTGFPGYDSIIGRDSVDSKRVPKTLKFLFPEDETFERRRRHAHADRRPRLPGAVPVHRQAQQADRGGGADQGNARADPRVQAEDAGITVSRRPR